MKLKKLIWTFGLIAGAINVLWMLSFVIQETSNIDFDKGELIGYTTMIISFSMIFIAVKLFRDKQNGGLITFGKAFKIGLFISIIASSIYVIVWQLEFYFFIPDFGEKYAQHMIEKMRSEGASDAELTKQLNEMKSFNEMYKNPFFNVLLTYSEILPVGLFVSLLTAAILKITKIKPVIA